ncbi:MAG: hypothetical protein GY765_16690 [bacterium]|nr:hypothetical protein [bacterium]
MTKKVMVLLVAVLMMAAFGTALEAQRGRNTMKHTGYGMRMVEQNLFPAKILLKMQDKIELTEAQVSKIEKMNAVYSEAKIREKAEIKIKELRFKTFLKKEKIDRGKMEKMVRELAKVKTDMKVGHLNYMLDLKALLTPEQIKKIEELKKKRRQFRKDKRNRRGKEGKQGKGMQGRRFSGDMSEAQQAEGDMSEAQQAEGDNSVS